MEVRNTRGSGVYVFDYGLNGVLRSQWWILCPPVFVVVVQSSGLQGAIWTLAVPEGCVRRTSEKWSWGSLPTGDAI